MARYFNNKWVGDWHLSSCVTIFISSGVPVNLARALSLGYSLRKLEDLLKEKKKSRALVGTLSLSALTKAMFSS